MNYLKVLYQKLDSVDVGCPDGCCKCCGPVMISLTEAKVLGIPGQVETSSKGEFNDTCQFVDDETGKCMVYDKRPFTCRLYGSAKCTAFNCPEVMTGTLSDKEVCMIFDAYTKLLILDGSDDFMEGKIDSMGHKMRQREIRNGWTKEELSLDVSPSG